MSYDRDAEKKNEMSRVCRMGNTERVLELLKGGMDPNQVEGRSTNYTLAIACTYDQCEVAKILVEHKADPNLHGRNGGWDSALIAPPLHTAAEHGNADMVKILLAAGASPLCFHASRKAKTIAANKECAALIRAAELEVEAKKTSNAA